MLPPRGPYAHGPPWGFYPPLDGCNAHGIPKSMHTPLQIQYVDIHELKPNPKNPNKHGDEQIERLAKVIGYQSFRVPVIVSNRSGYVVAGHGRIQAAKRAGLTQVPVIYQDFDSEEAEYSFVVSDNALAAWSELDLGAINMELESLGPDFDLELLGVEDFVLEPAEKFEAQADQSPDPHGRMITCPACGHHWSEKD